YFVRKSEFMPATIQPDNSEGRVYFEMKNIPGLRDESYSTSYRDFLQRVDFQLSAVSYRGSIRKYSTTWKEMTRELLEDKDFGSQLNKSISISSELKPLLSGAGYSFEKMKLIHEFVRKNIAWNNIDSKYSIDGLKRVVEKRQGTSGELNLLMINLLRSADIEADPMLVSERAHGRVDTSYPFKDQFNKVVAYVNIDDKKYILDASDSYTPSGMTPVELLNTVGFVVDRKRPVFVRIGDAGKKRSYVINVRSRIAPTAEIYSEASVDMYDYARISKAAKYKSNKEGYISEFLKSNPDMLIDSFTVSNLESDSLPLAHHLLLKHSMNKSGNYFLLNYNLFTGFDKNPFIADYRFTNIDFGAKYTCVVKNNFQLPDNMVVESFPKNSRISMPGNTLSATRQITQNDKEITVSLLIEFNTPQFGPDGYDGVKEFFKKMTEMLNEPIVLKSK
ncbi:MAG: transglutaminase-like domain-containing protein, partial [Flavisolibacter sp.]